MIQILNFVCCPKVDTFNRRHFYFNHAISKCTFSFLFTDKLPSIAKKDLKPLEEVVLECPVGKQIMVRKVRHFPEHNTECCPVESKYKISKGCNGKAKCEIILDKNVIGAGCVATMKKTSVKYKCVELGHKVNMPKLRRCRKNNKNGI